MPCCVDGLRDGDPVHSDGFLFRSGTSVRSLSGKRFPTDVAASLVPTVAAVAVLCVRRCGLFRQQQFKLLEVAKA